MANLERVTECTMLAGERLLCAVLDSDGLMA